MSYWSWYSPILSWSLSSLVSSPLMILSFTISQPLTSMVKIYALPLLMQPLNNLILKLFKATNINDTISSDGQKSGCPLAGCLWLEVPHKAAHKVLVTASISWGFNREGSISQLTHTIASRSRSLLAVGERYQYLAMWTLQRQLKTWQLVSPRLRAEREWLKLQSFQTLISEVTLFHFCHVLFVSTN